MWWSLAFVQAALVLASEVSRLGLEPPYINLDFYNANWELGGSSVLLKSGVELTGDYPGQQGWIVSREGDLPDNFQLDLEFHLHGDARALFGDGMALWFLEDQPRLHQGPVFGVQDQIKGTALVIDTYRNHRPGKAFPYMVLSQNDGTRKYDIDNDGLANELAGASLRGLYNSGQKPSRLRVVYRKGSNIQVSLNYHNDKWETFVDQPLNLNGARWLAFSASTGQLSSVNSIQRIRVEQLPELINVAGSPEPIQQTGQGTSHEDNTSTSTENSGSWSWFLLKLVVLAGLVLYGPKLWRKYKRVKGSILG